MNQHLGNRRALCSAMEIELSMVEGRRTPENTFWTKMGAENIITELMATLRGAEIEQIRADMEQIINENGLREYQIVFTDGSLIGKKVRYAIVTTQTNIKIGLAEPTTIFNAQLLAILEAVKLMRSNDVVKKNLQRLSKQPDSTTELSHQEKP
jgi:hypothetical protein